MINPVRRFRIIRAQYWRLKRLIFMSPAEARFIELMGGRLLYIHWIKSKQTGFCFTLVLSMGKILRSEKFKREVRYGRHFVDFANDLHRIIEIDGSEWHKDYVADDMRDMDIRARWTEARIMRIPAFRLSLDSAKVQMDALSFIRDGKY